LIEKWKAGIHSKGLLTREGEKDLLNIKITRKEHLTKEKMVRVQEGI
jgi:hypothetical protein